MSLNFDELRKKLAARLGIDLGEMVRLKFNKVSELYHVEERL